MVIYEVDVYVKTLIVIISQRILIQNSKFYTLNMYNFLFVNELIC